jgi:ribonuclease HII
MILGGIDEAGRGPVLGPLVVAGVASEEDEPFAGLGLKDSKLLTARAREKLAAEIRGRATRVETIVASAEEIDLWRKTLTMNQIEVRLFTMVARALKADALIVDAADPDAKRFGIEITAGLRTDCKVFSAHHADRDEPIVSAASIIAKTERDRLMQHISRLCVQRYGLETGSGYASDPITQRFLDEVVRTTRELPIEARRSWATSRDVLRKHGCGPEARLDAFTDD